MWDSFVATAGEPGGLGFLTEQLRELVVINDEIAADPVQGSHAVDRITLRQLLLSGLDDVVHFGKTCTHYEQHGSKVTAFFDDGSRTTGDLLVGADGAGSAVRRQFLPHAESPLLAALSSYEAEMRASGYAAVRTALHTQRQGLRSNRIAVAGARAWFRACRAVPRLQELNLAYREQARPRAWERQGNSDRQAVS